MADLVEVLSLALFVAEVGGAEDGSGAGAWRLLEPEHREAWHARTRNMLSALEAAGYRVVPVEPTETMERAGCFALHNAEEALMAASLSGDKHATARVKMRRRWAAMVRAAPKVDSPAAEGGSCDG